MSFVVRTGKPEVEAFWKDLDAKHVAGSLSRDEDRFFKLLVKAARLLADNPRYPGLNSHEISSLYRRYGCPVWESYLQSNAPAAGRIFWVYGPGKGEITIIGIEPHPEDTVRGYARVKLTDLPEVTKSAESEQKHPRRKKR